MRRRYLLDVAPQLGSNLLHLLGTWGLTTRTLALAYRAQPKRFHLELKPIWSRLHLLSPKPDSNYQPKSSFSGESSLIYSLSGDFLV